MIVKYPNYRDDLYSLSREGSRISISGLDPIGQHDRAHIFQDGKGEIIPASKLRSENALYGITGETYKLGPTHSHGERHSGHYIESAEPEKDLIKRLKRTSQTLRDRHREGED